MSKISRIQKRFSSERFTGFGAKSANQGDRLMNRDGSFNVKRTGQNFIQRLNPYHQLITMSWFRFNTLILCTFITVNLAFTFLYYCIGLHELTGMVHDKPLEKFIEVFSYSAQTLTTVGYGRVNPVGMWANLIASFEALMGLTGFALVTGLLYGRFSRPQAKLLSSNNILVAPFGDKTAIMFRIANGRRNQLVDCEATLLMNYIEKETGARRFINLELEYKKINALSLSWTLVHPITDASPFWQLNMNDIQDMKCEIFLMFNAFDDTYSQNIHARISYSWREFIWGARFEPMYKRDESGNSTVLELDKISDFTPVELPADIS